MSVNENKSHAAQPPDGPATAAAAAQEAPPNPPATNPPATLAEESGVYHMLLGWVIIGFVILLSFDGTRSFLKLYWAHLGVAALTILFVGWAIYVSRKLRRARSTVNALLVFLILMPALLLLLGLVLSLPAAYQVPAARIVFLLLACVLPLTMYYLFIATRKPALLNEFVANLGRLGLLKPEGDAADPVVQAEFQNRVETYLQKFEAIYGPLPVEDRKRVVDFMTSPEPTETPNGLKLSHNVLTDLFTPAVGIPLAIATLLIGLGWLLTLPPWKTAPWYAIVPPPSPVSTAAPAPSPGPLPVTQPAAAVADGADEGTDRWLAALSPERTPMNFAFLGAYFFSLQLLFRRYVRKDLGASAYVWVSMRLILTTVLTWVAVVATSVAAQTPGEAPLGPDALLVLGFVIGVFPQMAWHVVRAALRPLARLIPSFSSGLPLSELDGLTVWHEARLQEEDIENVPNMATADPVELMLQTPFPPDRLIDWVDQAILYTHLGPTPRGKNAACRRTELRAHGVRTASALVHLCAKKPPAEVTGPFAVSTNVPYQLAALACALSTHPTLRLIQSWRRLAPGTAAAAEAAEATTRSDADVDDEFPRTTQPDVTDPAVTRS